jgi:hypothetical protein
MYIVILHMKLEYFNLENLVHRSIFMNESPEKSMQVLNNYYRLSALLEKREYSAEDKKTIANIIHNYDESKSRENYDEFYLQ